MRILRLKAQSSVKGSASFWETVGANAQMSRSVQARDTSELLEARIIEGACWSDDQLAILVPGAGLHFAAVGQQVAWHVITSAQFATFSSSWASDPEPVRLSRLCADGAIFVSDMDRKQIVTRIVGKRMSRIVVDEFGVYMYVKANRRYLSLHSHLLLGSDLPFLEWCEDED